jgi:hypothetical protein
MNWVARSVVHGRPELATTGSAASLDPKFGFDPLVRGQVAGNELDALPAPAAAPAEHTVAPRVAQPRDDEPPERARAAGDPDR